MQSCPMLSWSRARICQLCQPCFSNRVHAYVAHARIARPIQLLTSPNIKSPVGSAARLLGKLLAPFQQTMQDYAKGFTRGGRKRKKGSERVLENEEISLAGGFRYHNADMGLRRIKLGCLSAKLWRQFKSSCTGSFHHDTLGEGGGKVQTAGSWSS